MKKLFSEVPYIKSERLVLRKIGEEDAEGLWELAHSPNVYKYLPTFLFEQKYEDIHHVIRRLYNECFQESIILGVFAEDGFCGLAEIYGYREETHKASTMVANTSISHVVEKNNFLLVVSGVGEDWGYAQPTPANKWVWLL